MNEREIASRLLSEQTPAVIATITRVIGSSSQPLGTRMIISSDGSSWGAVSGGCVEGDIRRVAMEVLADGRPRLQHYKKVEDPILEVGLNCEGRIDVLLEPLSEETLPPALPRDDREAALVTVRYSSADPEHPSPERHVLPWPPSEETLGDGAVVTTLLATEAPFAHQSATGEILYCEPVLPRPTLAIFSAAEPAGPLSRIAAVMGFRVIVTDPRDAYADPDRFPDAAAVYALWPSELPKHERLGNRTFVVSLNHEPKFEDDLFRMLMEQPAVAYIGAIGKAKRQEERLARQDRAGYDLSKLPAVHTPIGIKLGGRDAAAIALSIMAEIQTVRYKTAVSRR